MRCHCINLSYGSAQDRLFGQAFSGTPIFLAYIAPMLDRLLIMRHAKSSWSDGALRDHQRPLNDRGKTSATNIGAALHARGYAPQIIWSSDAVRTRETAMRLIRAIPGAQAVEYISGFYHASAENVIEICNSKPEPDGTLMLLGHNPGWTHLHHYLSGQWQDYPTGACGVFERLNDGHWLSPASWRLKEIIYPRDLE